MILLCNIDPLPRLLMGRETFTACVISCWWMEDRGRLSCSSSDWSSSSILEEMYRGRWRGGRVEWQRDLRTWRGTKEVLVSHFFVVFYFVQCFINSQRCLLLILFMLSGSYQTASTVRPAVGQVKILQTFRAYQNRGSFWNQTYKEGLPPAKISF